MREEMKQHCAKLRFAERDRLVEAQVKQLLAGEYREKLVEAEEKFLANANPDEVRAVVKAMSYNRLLRTYKLAEIATKYDLLETVEIVAWKNALAPKEYERLYLEGRLPIDPSYRCMPRFTHFGTPELFEKVRAEVMAINSGKVTRTLLKPSVKAAMNLELMKHVIGKYKQHTSIIEEVLRTSLLYGELNPTKIAYLDSLLTKRTPVTVTGYYLTGRPVIVDCLMNALGRKEGIYKEEIYEATNLFRVHHEEPKFDSEGLLISLHWLRFRAGLVREDS